MKCKFGVSVSQSGSVSSIGETMNGKRIIEFLMWEKFSPMEQIFLGLCKLDESYFEINNDNKISVLKDAKSDFASAKAEIVTQLTDDQIRLYKSQQAMDDTSRTKEFFGLSLHEYMLKLIQKGKYKEAENVKKDFKMSDKKYWWIKVRYIDEFGYGFLWQLFAIF